MGNRCKGWRGGLDPSCEEEEYTKIEESESSGNLNLTYKRSLVMYSENLKASRWVAVKPSLIASRTRTKLKKRIFFKIGS